MKLEADAGDAAAGDLAGGKGLAVFVGEVAKAMRLGGLFQPEDEGFHLGVDDFLCASEADADDYERHVGNSEMAFGAFPQTELNGAIVAEVVETGSDRVPIECGIIGIAAEHFRDIGTEVLSANLGCIRHSSSKLGSALIGTRSRGRCPLLHRGLQIRFLAWAVRVLKG